MGYSVSESCCRFLLWGYFKIDGTEDVDDVIKSAINKAYDDATRQGAFNTRYDKNTDVHQIKNGALECMLEKVKKIESYDEWHKSTCDEIVKKFKDVKYKNDGLKDAFTYGNAQKFVNMTIKYLYVIGNIINLNGDGFEGWYKNNIIKFEADFHIPIDNYILQYLYKDNILSNKIKEIDANEYYKIIGRNCEYSWSQIPSYDAYLEFQNEIKKIIGNKDMPLEWENEVWIKIARKRIG